MDEYQCIPKARVYGKATRLANKVFDRYEGGERDDIRVDLHQLVL